MRREHLEHLIRAAGSLTGTDDIIVIGSQAILGAYPRAPQDLLASIEADVFPRDDPQAADLIDGSIGEGSPFHETFGYYAQGVAPETAVLPAGWDGRLVRVENPNTRGVRGWCLEPHDLVVSKLVAGRGKDLDFIKAALRHRMVGPGTLRERLAALPAGAGEGADLASRLDRLLRGAGV